MNTLKSYFHQGKNFLQEKNFQQAIEQYNLALQVKPNSIIALRQLSKIHDRLKNYEQAIEYLKRLLEYQPNELKDVENLARIYIKLGKIFQEKGQHKEEENCYLKALSINQITINQITAGSPISEGMPQPYQRRDIDIVDYQIYPMEDKKNNKVFGFRGPQPLPLEKSCYFVGLGPATTFGCYTKRPYLWLLEQDLGLPNLNLGMPGCGATLLNQEDNSLLIDLVNDARFAIVLVMSARSHSSRLHRPARLGSLSSPQIMKELSQYFKKDRPFLRGVITDMRNSFVEDYIKLTQKIKVPKILLYLSHHSLDYEDNYDLDFPSLHQGFPHFINRETVDRVIHHFDDFVECHSLRGYPQKLISRFTGEPVTNKQGEYNTGYASPEMHEDAAKLLLPVCQKYL